jgi:amino acid transporter
VSKLSTATRRLLIGRPFRSDRLSHTLLPKRIALPVFASDALSSVAYAPEEVFLMLSVAGVTAYALTPWIGLAVAAVMLVVVASYRQNVHAYPSGGGDYEVVTTNLGDTAGLVVASALMVDYVLTVAVSTASAMANIGSAIPLVAQHKVFFCVVSILLVMALNLRGVRESGLAFAIPTYAFIVGVVVMIGWGLFRIFVLGNPLRAESAGFQMHSAHGQVVGFALAFLVARSFSSGCAALTGVEAISNGVPAFQKPKSRNAATTLLMLGGIAVTLLMGIIVLAQQIRVQLVEDPATQLGGAPKGYYQKTLVTQLAQTVFGSFHIGFLLIATVTALILVLAANTAFNGFPVLGSILAQHSYLPRQLHTRGDRLAFSNGILFLSGAALLAIIAFRGEVTALIQLYIVGVHFVHVESDRHGAALDPVAAHRNRSAGAAQDDAFAGGQHGRIALHRHGVVGGSGDQVRSRGVDRPFRDELAVRNHENDSPTLQHGEPGIGGAGRGPGRCGAAQP